MNVELDNILSKFEKGGLVVFECYSNTVMQLLENHLRDNYTIVKLEKTEKPVLQSKYIESLHLQAVSMKEVYVILTKPLSIRGVFKNRARLYGVADIYNNSLSVDILKWNEGNLKTLILEM